MIGRWAYLFGALAVLGAAAAVAQESSSVTVGMELGAVNCAFRLDQVKVSPGVVFSRRGDAWLGRDRCHTTLIGQATVGSEWQDMWVEFVPAGDGAVNLTFFGDLHVPLFPGDAPLVWIDDVAVAGAALVNGGFEAATTNGVPAGWQFGGQFGTARYPRDGRVAHGGRACVAVSWSGGEAVQTLKVTRGQPCRIRVWHRRFDPRRPAVTRVPSEDPFPRYRQEFEIEFRDADAAARAQVGLAPLYDDRAWAVSSRWDDNNGEDILMRDVLARHGQHGTFYLNGLVRDWAAIPASITSDAFGREIIKNGNSIGGHSLTHPWLSTCSRNRIFEETAGVRIQWEAAVDKPVLSYSFSFCNCWNFVERYRVQADVFRLLERAGFYHIAIEPLHQLLPSDLILSPILPGDAQEIDWYVDAALASPWYRERHPNLSYSMHVYYSRITNGWAGFEADLDRYGHRPDWWYCNQNEYAAYRYQFERSRLAPPRRSGRTLRCRLERPLLLDLNDAVPLTVRVSGVDPGEVAAVRCATADCAPSDRPAESYRFHLGHDRDQALPVKIGLVPPNVDYRTEPADHDQDTDFAGVRALLHFEDGKLNLILDNRSAQPLTGVRVTARLPLGWREGVLRRAVADLPVGARREVTFAPTPAGDYKYHSGTTFFVAQLDFRHGTLPGRLHTACLHANPPDPSYPQGGFMRLGPFVQSQVDLAQLGEQVRAGAIDLRPWLLPDDARLEWRPEEPADLLNDVELVAVPQGASEPEAFLLASDVVSERDQTVELRAVQAYLLGIWLNGEDIRGRREIALRAGTNRLWVLHYAVGTAYFRMLKSGTGERARDIRFRLPAVLAGAAPYEPPARGPVKRKALAGAWRAALLHRLPSAPSIEAAHRDTGLSPEARKAVAADADDRGWKEVAVPAQWASYGGEWAGANGEAVFRRTVNVPAAWAGKDLRLSLGAIDDFDETFVNGTAVGRTDITAPDFYTVPRRYRVPGALVKAGPNVVAVRVFDRYGGGGLVGQPGDLYVAPAE